MKEVRALFFDVGGTVFDWKNTVKEKIGQLEAKEAGKIDGEGFATDWRKEMFKVHTQVRQGNLAWMNSDDMHLMALENLKTRYPFLARVDGGDFVRSTWHELKAFAGAAEAIDRLRTGYTVVVLTILSWESIVSSSKKAGVQWDGLLSCEFLGYYKPSLQAYRKAASLMGLKPEEGMMVAAHEGDLAAARTAGMHTALVKVPEKDDMSEAFEAPDTIDFDITAEDFEGLCKALGI